MPSTPSATQRSPAVLALAHGASPFRGRAPVSPLPDFATAVPSSIRPPLEKDDGFVGRVAPT